MAHGIVPYEHQVEKADKAFSILSQHGLVYLTMEERTGKTLTAILCAQLSGVKKVAVITKKKPLEDWIKTLKLYSPTFEWEAINYESVHKLEMVPDLVILDESHNFLSGYPKPSTTWQAVAKVTLSRGIPLIFSSATPHPQGFQMLYHQLALSKFSPWKRYPTFYSWFKSFGVPNTKWVGQRQVNDYSKTNSALVQGTWEHLKVGGTREELGFEHEPEDKIHFIKLSEETKDWYNYVVKNKLSPKLDDGSIAVLDTIGGMRAALHAIEGGTLKVDDAYYDLEFATEKIDFIKKTWGDTDKLGIFHQWKGEEGKLKKHFKNAVIMQGDRFAEGVELSHLEHLVVYSQSWSTAKHTQRRARQASKNRRTEIVVHFLLVKGALSEQCYSAVAVNKVNFVDSCFERGTI